jgi:uncharacterized membrane protein
VSIHNHQSTVRQYEQNTMKTLAFCIALFIFAAGAVGLLMPSGLEWMARHSLTSSAFYVIGTVRAALGLLLISVASASRLPKTLRVLGCLILIAGISTVLTGLLAMEQARGIIEGWMQQGSGVIRLTCIPVLVLGGLVAYACAPARRAEYGQRQR